MLKIMFTPAATAAMHSRRCSARAASWLATSPLEHAVSTDTQGPCIPSTNDTRPATTEHWTAVAAYTLCPAGLDASTLAYSLAHIPTYTPTHAPISSGLVSATPCSVA